MQPRERDSALAAVAPDAGADDLAPPTPAERLRRSEVLRMQLEERLEAQEERLSQAHERHRHEVEALRRDLAAARASGEELALGLARSEAESAAAAGDRDRHEARARQAGRELATARRNLEQTRAMRAELQQKLRLADIDLQKFRRELQALRKAHGRDLAAAEATVEGVRAQVTTLHAQLAVLQQDATRYRGAAIGAERRAEATRNTISFRLGRALLDAKTWSGLRALPSALWALRQEVRARRSGTRAAGPPSRGAWLHELEPTLQAQGLQAAEALARGRAKTPAELATAFTRLARLVLRADAAAAARLAREANQVEPRPFRAKWLAFLLHDAGQIVEPRQLLDALPPGTPLHASEKHRRRYIEGQHALVLQLPTVPPRRVRPSFDPVPGRLLYVAASSLPYNVSGYTLRTQGLLAGLAAHGRELLCVTRPGYPADRTDAASPEDAGEREVDGVHYLALPGPHRRRTAPDQYIQECARLLAEEARAFRPALVQAASNHEAALPALLAARAVGLPFVYEVRGLWEYTTASKIAGWEGTERFALERALETLVAREADLVFTLTAALADELVLRGVDRARIRLAPNAIDPDALRPAARDAALAASLGIAEGAFVAGYVGSVIGYEGLDDLVSALALLRQSVPGARLLVVGDGDALPALRTQAAAAGLAESIVFAGKVPPSEVARYYALMDALCLPRKPFKVCQLVSPIKPAEAMLLRVPLVVSDVAALKEMVREGETALVHPAGDARALADCLLRLERDRPLGRRLAAAAATEVLASRTWQHVTARMHEALDALQPQAPANAAVAVPAADDAGPLPVQTRREKLGDEEKALLAERLGAALAAGGREGLRRFLTLQGHGHSARFRAFCELKGAQACLQAGDTEGAFALADSALALDASAGSLRAAARIRYNGADLRGAVALAERLEALAPGSDERLLAELRGRLRLAEWAALPPRPRALPARRGRVLNVLAFSLPYASVGYATRSHGLALGIRQAGWDVRPCTRPGFPFDTRPELKGQPLPGTDTIDGIVYRRLFAADRGARSEVEYLHDAIALYEELIREEQPELVHAASNYVTALPALIAARRLGVPFVYEVRGFWEVTRASRDGRFEHTPKYRFMQLFEGLVARHADRVVTITEAMRETLAADGVPPQRMAVAYNGVDPQRFAPAARDDALAQRLGLPRGVPVIGYAGSFVDYEGLDDLVAACGLLADRGIDFRLLLVGDGAASDGLRAQVAATPWAARCIFTGRVPHGEVEAYYSLVDIAPFPRKPWEVCELVSPLKPFEAMAAEKAVVVSGTRALREVVRHERNGLVFDKGSVEALAQALERLVADADLRAELGRAARAWVQEHRSWDEAGRACVATYEALRADAAVQINE